MLLYGLLSVACTSPKAIADGSSRKTAPQQALAAPQDAETELGLTPSRYAKVEQTLEELRALEKKDSTTQKTVNATANQAPQPFAPFNIVHGLTLPSDDLSFSNQTCADRNENASIDTFSVIQDGWIGGYVYARLEGETKNGRPLADYVDSQALLMLISMYCSKYPTASVSDAGDAAAANAAASR